MTLDDQQIKKLIAAIDTKAREAGVSTLAILARLERGVPLEDALRGSVRARARNSGTKLSINTIYARIRRGWSVDDALCGNPRPRLRTKEIVWASKAVGISGKQISLRGLVEARKAVVGYTAVRRRLAAGWALETALSAPPYARLKADRKSIRALAIAAGMKPKRVYTRLSRGVPLEIALQPVMPRKKYPSRKRPDSILSRAAAAGVPAYTVYYRMRKRGETFEEAIKPERPARLLSAAPVPRARKVKKPWRPWWMK